LFTTNTALLQLSLLLPLLLASSPGLAIASTVGLLVDLAAINEDTVEVSYFPFSSCSSSHLAAFPAGELFRWWFYLQTTKGIFS
jgi:hypothetical protein